MPSLEELFIRLATAPKRYSAIFATNLQQHNFNKMTTTNRFLINCYRSRRRHRRFCAPRAQRAVLAPYVGVMDEIRCHNHRLADQMRLGLISHTEYAARYAYRENAQQLEPVRTMLPSRRLSISL